MYSSQPGDNFTQEGDQMLVCASAPLAIFGFVFYSAILCLGVLGNVFVIFAVFRDSNLHTPFNYLVVNLAVSDMCVLFFSLPLVVFNECFSWPFGELACRLTRPLFLIFTGVSVSTMITLSFERYRAVVTPLALKITNKKALRIIVVIWVAACCIFGLPRSFVFGLTIEKGILQCDPVRQSFAIQTVTQILRIIVTLIAPCIVVSWTYTRVMRKLRHDLAVIGGAYASRDMERSRAKKNVKAMRLLVTIIFVFVVCFLPFNTVTLLDSLSAYKQWNYNETIENMSRMLQVSHSCFNPMILCLLSSDFQKALKELCGCVIHRKVLNGRRKVFVLLQLQQSDNSTSPTNADSGDTSL